MLRVNVLKRPGNSAFTVILVFIEREPLRMFAVQPDGFDVEQKEQFADPLVIQLLFIAQLPVIVRDRDAGLDKRIQCGAEFPLCPAF